MLPGMKQDAGAKAYADAVAAVIRRRRESADLSMHRLSEGAGLSQPMIGLIERGIHAPTVATLFRIAKTLGTTPAALLAEVEATPIPPETGSKAKVPRTNVINPARKKPSIKSAKATPAKKRPKPL